MAGAITRMKLCIVEKHRGGAQMKADEFGRARRMAGALNKLKLHVNGKRRGHDQMKDAAEWFNAVLLEAAWKSLSVFSMRNIAAQNAARKKSEDVCRRGVRTWVVWSQKRTAEGEILAIADEFGAARRLACAMDQLKVLATKRRRALMSTIWYIDRLRLRVLLAWASLQQHAHAQALRLIPAVFNEDKRLKSTGPRPRLGDLVLQKLSLLLWHHAVTAQWIEERQVDVVGIMAARSRIRGAFWCWSRGG